MQKDLDQEFKDFWLPYAKKHNESIITNNFINNQNYTVWNEESYKKMFNFVILTLWEEKTWIPILMIPLIIAYISLISYIDHTYNVQIFFWWIICMFPFFFGVSCLYHNLMYCHFSKKKVVYKKSLLTHKEISTINYRKNTTRTSLIYEENFRNKYYIVVDK